MSVPARPSVVQSESVIERVRIHSEFQIPAACDAILIYKVIKHTLHNSYSASHWFWVEFRGLGTHEWIWKRGLTLEPKSENEHSVSQFSRHLLIAFEPLLS